LRQTKSAKRNRAICPEFIATPYLENHRILILVIDHAAVIDELPGAPSPVAAALRECQQLLVIRFELMTILESTQTPLAEVDRLVVESSQKLAEARNECTEPNSPQIYIATTQAITKYLLTSTFVLLQLADVLTPPGREEGRSKLVTGGRARRWSNAAHG
jgi:hypothetical protein